MRRRMEAGADNTLLHDDIALTVATVNLVFAF